MPFTYNKLWKLLIDKKMTKVELTKKIGISSSTMAKMGKDENVSLDVVDKICVELGCGINDILEYIPQCKKELIAKKSASRPPLI